MTLRLNPHFWKHGCSSCSILRPLSNLHQNAGEWWNTNILMHAQNKKSSDTNSGQLSQCFISPFSSRLSIQIFYPNTSKKIRCVFCLYKRKLSFQITLFRVNQHILYYSKEGIQMQESTYIEPYSAAPLPRNKCKNEISRPLELWQHNAENYFSL